MVVIASFDSGFGRVEWLYSDHGSLAPQPYDLQRGRDLTPNDLELSSQCRKCTKPRSRGSELAAMPREATDEGTRLLNVGGSPGRYTDPLHNAFEREHQEHRKGWVGKEKSSPPANPPAAEVGSPHSALRGRGARTTHN